MYKIKAKKYCIAAGCRNNDKTTDLQFFTLPKDKERRRKWLTLIDREDLLEKEDMISSSYCMCSVHFDNSSMKIVKRLKDDAVPKHFLYNQSQEGPSCSKEPSTSENTKCEATVTSNEVYKKCSRCSESDQIKGKITLSNDKEYVTKGTQTENCRIITLAEVKAQASKSFTKGTSKKRKFHRNQNSNAED